MLDVVLALNGVLNIIEPLETDQPLQIASFGEAVD